MSVNSLSLLSDQVINNIRNAIKIIKTVGEAETWRQHINKIILLLQRYLRKHKKYGTGTTKENVHKLEANLSLLKVFREKLKTIKRKTGAGLKPSCKILWQDVKSVFNNRIKTGVIINKSNIKDPKIFLKRAITIFKNQIKKALKSSILKVNVILSGNFILPSSGENEIKTFNTKNTIIDHTTNIEEWYMENVMDVIMKDLEEFQERDSGWSLYEILHLKVNINNYEPITMYS